MVMPTVVKKKRESKKEKTYPESFVFALAEYLAKDKIEKFKIKNKDGSPFTGKDIVKHFHEIHYV